MVDRKVYGISKRNLGCRIFKFVRPIIRDRFWTYADVDENLLAFQKETGVVKFRNFQRPIIRHYNCVPVPYGRRKVYGIYKRNLGCRILKFCKAHNRDRFWPYADVDKNLLAFQKETGILKFWNFKSPIIRHYNCVPVP